MPTMAADAMLALGRRFLDSRIFLSAAELDIFSLLAKETMSAKEVSDKLSATLRGTTINCCRPGGRSYAHTSLDR